MCLELKLISKIIKKEHFNLRRIKQLSLFYRHCSIWTLGQLDCKFVVKIKGDDSR